MKTIDEISEKYTSNFNLFKKNIEKDNEYCTNLFVIRCLVDRMSVYFAEFRDHIICNKIYKSLKFKFKEIIELSKNGKDEVQKHVYWIKFQNKICGLFDDINLIYKAVIKSSGDIDNLFKHSLMIISKEKNVNHFNKLRLV